MKRVKTIGMIIVLLIILIVICCALHKKHKIDDEVKTMLLDLYELEYSYKRMFGSFTKCTHALAFIQDTLVTEVGEAHYYVEIENADDSTFSIKAISAIDFDNDGVFSEWQINEKGELQEVLED